MLCGPEMMSVHDWGLLLLPAVLAGGSFILYRLLVAGLPRERNSAVPGTAHTSAPNRKAKESRP